LDISIAVQQQTFLWTQAAQPYAFFLISDIPPWPLIPTLVFLLRLFSLYISRLDNIR